MGCTITLSLPYQGGERSAACQSLGISDGEGWNSFDFFNIFDFANLFDIFDEERGLWVCLVADFFDIFDFDTPLQGGQYTIEIFENLESSSISRDRGGVRDDPGAF